ncbi:ABC transporter substrate-binding protein [Paenibacillus sp.]|uniref:ABC transporter substrate-binding protein n=1 Tax=Paenibacillus sp. TaxID=58172 RepID=UPI002D742853|nr:extracellular solute-binding protein [Paenibacillus sp.]HZG86422.1 extracellular solute-binding protein [Paenibacillus sp.]
MKQGLLNVFLSFGVLVLGSLAGCSQPANVTLGSGSSRDDPAAPPEVVRLEFLQQKREQVEAFNALIAKFQAEYPHIVVEQVSVPDGQQVLQTKIANDNPPDLFTHFPTNANFKLLAQRGYVMELTDDPMLEHVSDDILSDYAIEGKQYLLPLTLNTTGVFYNKAIFETHRLAIPRTYEDFMDICQTLQEANVVPLLFSDHDENTIGHQAKIFFINHSSNRDDMFVDAMNGVRRLSEHPDMREIAEKLLQIRAYGQPHRLQTSYEAALRGFAEGEGAMYITGNWAIPLIRKENPSLRFGMFPLPAERAEDTRVIAGIDSAIAIASGSRHPEEALTFLRFMARVENAQLFSDLDAGAPSAFTNVRSGESEEIELMMDMIRAGKNISWPNARWKSGMMEDERIALQNLVATKDVDRFLREIDEIFYEK